MDKLLDVLLGVMCTIITLGFCVVVYVMFDGMLLKTPEYKQYMSENRCIAKKVALGIERSNIVRDSGSCTTIKSYGASSRVGKEQ